MAHISLVMMIKNEELRLNVTLESTKGYVDSLIIYDTGSTDKTVEIVQTYCKKNNLPLYLLQGEFVDFSTSRNILLDYACSIKGVDYYLLLDCNDELRGGSELRKEADRYLDMKEHEVFLTTQEWLAGTEITKYLNTRFIRAGSQWRYKGRVHEFLIPPPGLEEKYSKENKTLERPKLNEKVVIYQDRNKDDDKTSKRFNRDKKILLESVESDPKNARDIFYLAQTYACLNEHKEALVWYLKRVELLDGFWEERFHSYLRAGEIYLNNLNEFDKALPLLMKAFEVDKRVEPLVILGRYYKDKKEFLTAYMFLILACELKFPHYAILFINRKDYDYTRYHLLGIVGYYCEKYRDGEKACREAIKTGVNPELDSHNLQFYQEKLREGKLQEEKLREEKDKKETKKQFFDRRMIELKISSNSASRKTLERRINLEWKLRDKQNL